MVASVKVTVLSVPTLIYKATAKVTILLQTPQGALYIGGPTVSVVEGFLMNSTTTGIELTLAHNDEIWGISLPNETSLARILILS